VEATNEKYFTASVDFHIGVCQQQLSEAQPDGKKQVYEESCTSLESA
jgi:hypothetical protein